MSKNKSAQILMSGSVYCYMIRPNETKNGHVLYLQKPNWTKLTQTKTANSEKGTIEENRKLITLPKKT